MLDNLGTDILRANSNIPNGIQYFKNVLKISPYALPLAKTYMITCFAYDSLYCGNQSVKFLTQD